MSWQRVRAVARRHYYVLRRAPHRWFDVTIWPLVDVLLFGSIAAFVGQRQSASRVAGAYLLAGIVLWHVVYQSQIAIGTGFLEETWSRNLLSLLVAPVREVEYVAGVALFGLVKLAIGVGVAVAVALGVYAFDPRPAGLAAVPVVAVLLVIGWVIGLFVIGLLLRFGSGAEVLAWGIFFVIMPLSGVFYPLRALPRFLRPVAEVLPTTHAFTAGRAVFAGRAMPWNELGVATAETVVIAVLVLAFVARMLGVFRARGYISRYT